ncbi:MAG: hypothetical protein HKN13_04915 [Rhodothermales bacterium]|nr:hypothetical protein [Rhodothermales bacterium]
MSSDVRPSPDRTRRWAQAIARAGTAPLTSDGLSRLQEVVVGDTRFVRLGYRQGGGFVGTRDRRSRAPIPEHISARPDDLDSLMRGLEAFVLRVREHGMDPVAATATAAFGFTYIHPFEDGNGRIHRWLIHHLLAATGYTPEGLVFPVSQVMLRRIEEYRHVLESYSERLLPLISWSPTPEGNVEVTNETVSYYRYFDATAHAEYLYHCVAETVDHDLPREVAYLEAFDRFKELVQTIVDMPETTLDLLRGFLDQNEGLLSTRARRKEFAALTEREIEAIERMYRQTIGEVRAKIT